ncbi:virulence RhuM family protein [uncultured Desulfovibrio sp.]|uniref:virulence RhuM family protein n=1 Tax=uncultured Desulfovibrio sp. TaxID=167968 RepID=UPI002639D98B|nr:virulence RhuM family protein [uncultured Desulfovibrio sp.]
MDNTFRFLMYHSAEQNISVNAVIRDETIWLTQKAMAELFGVQTPAINKHLKNIFAEGELDENVVVSKMEITTQHGAIPDKTQTREALFYNLDAIISVGYRVNSRRATQFRIWATNVLKEYMIKGFAMDDERLKQGRTAFGKDYFRELLERVRSIRASERRIWQQITDIFAECSLDYDRNSPVTRQFYAMVQNKFHYAITGQTSAEIIYAGADRHKEHMGLTTWKNAPEGRILKSDVTIAKNYLTEQQIRQLERTVTGYFDYIEDLIERENTFTMEEFAASINEFLTFRRYDILPDKGKISREQAVLKAEAEYDEFNKTQHITSDFDRTIRKMLNHE